MISYPHPSGVHLVLALAQDLCRQDLQLLGLQPQRGFTDADLDDAVRAASTGLIQSRPDGAPPLPLPGATGKPTHRSLSLPPVTMNWLP
jgi:hypothetical protein